jgi:hypothetical protein
MIGSHGTEIDFAYGDVPLPQAVRPLILLHGSDREMGVQYYQQLIQVFGSWILERVAYDRLTDAEEQAMPWIISRSSGAHWRMWSSLAGLACSSASVSRS